MADYLNVELIREALEELSSRREQQRLWLSLGNGEVSSFPEVVSRLYDDSGLFAVLDKSDVPESLTAEGLELLRQLRKLISKIDQSESPEKLIESPFMAQIRSVALKCLNASSAG